MLPIASPMIERYSSNGFLCCGGTRMGGWRRYYLISSKAFWHSSFYACGSFFLRSLKMDSQVEVSLAMNQLMYCSRTRNPLISFSFLGGGISNMALILDGSTSILLSLTKKLSSFLTVTPKVHFWEFNLNLYSLILSKNFLKLKIDLLYPWISQSYHQHTLSTSLCIISCNRVVAILWKLLLHSWAQMALWCNNKFRILWWR